ncbi:MFS transporter [Bacillus sp. B15-48]|uniref:MFS transporter n=1 Tax=Bacillus sp. B15-48 TaxID=1548601 RepID=UPI00193F8A79|nr:MFS transporter [Bacillus sp. B15-48]MBM4765043.1 MFS transporter [Bacillus sp. B15-48]
MSWLKEDKERLWTKSFILLMIGNLFTFMSFQMLIPTLPPYIKSVGATGTEIGLVTALFSIGAIISRPIIGYLLEYRDRKPLVFLGAGALFLLTLLYPISQIIMVFLLFRLLHGLAWGWSTTVMGTAAVDIIPRSRLGEGMGYFGLSITIGMIIAPSIGIVLFQYTSFTNFILISSGLGAIAFVLLMSVGYQTPELVKQTKKEDLKFSYFRSTFEKSCWFPATVTLLICLGYGTIVTFIVIFGEERGITEIYLYYLANAIFATISRPIAGKWFDLKGPKGLVVVMTAVTFIGMWILSFAHSSLMLAVAGAIIGIGFGSLMPTLQSWTVSETTVNRRGVGTGMFMSALDFGLGFSGLVFGMMLSFFDIGRIFQISSLFLVLSIILTLVVSRKKSASTKQQIAAESHR